MTAVISEGPVDEEGGEAEMVASSICRPTRNVDASDDFLLAAIQDRHIVIKEDVDDESIITNAHMARQFRYRFLTLMLQS